MELRPLFTLIVAVVVPFSFVSLLALGQDDPDLQKEKNFYNNYSHFNQSPTNEESWAGATNGKAQTYSVQGGDTLWGLSETLFGDPNYWPKIWSLNNEEIGNPHEILPRQEIRFFLGTMGEAPSLAVGDATESPQTPNEVEKAEPSALEIPEPQKKHTPVSGLPGSLPKWSYRKDKRQEIVMEVEKINRDFGAPDEVLTYYMADKKIEGVGEISETEMGLSSAAEFQYVFVKLPTAASEKRMMVVKNMGALEDKARGVEGEIIQVQGEIEVLEAVNAEDNLYRALVRKVLSPIEVGAKVVPGELPVYNSRDEGSGGTAPARLIGGQFNKSRVAFGPSNIVYLAGQGLSLGQSYPVYKVQSLRVENSKGFQSPRVIGHVKVINTAQNFATAVVLNASDDLRVGDVTDPGAVSKK